MALSSARTPGGLPEISRNTIQNGRESMEREQEKDITHCDISKSEPGQEACLITAIPLVRMNRLNNPTGEQGNLPNLGCNASEGS